MTAAHLRSKTSSEASYFDYAEVQRTSWSLLVLLTPNLPVFRRRDRTVEAKFLFLPIAPKTIIVESKFAVTTDRFWLTETFVTWPPLLTPQRGVQIDHTVIRHRWVRSAEDCRLLWSTPVDSG